MRLSVESRVLSTGRESTYDSYDESIVRYLETTGRSNAPLTYFGYREFKLVFDSFLRSPLALTKALVGNYEVHALSFRNLDTIVKLGR